MKALVLPLAFGLGSALAFAQSPGKIVAYTQVETTTETSLRGDTTPRSIDYAQSQTGALAGIDGAVNCIKVLASNFMYVGGTFSTVNGLSIPRFTRLLPNGTLDTSFNLSGNGFGAGVVGASVDAIAVENEGSASEKVLVGGEFASYNGTPATHLFRVDNRGVRDATFTGSMAGRVFAIATGGPNGSYYIGGNFSRNIVRLTSSGADDPSFAAGTARSGANGVVRAIVVHEGKVLIGGDFSSYEGVTRNRIARLNSDGSLDTSFDPGTTLTDSVHCILVHGGKILVGGKLSTVGSAPRCIRLNSDGSLDTAFNSPATDGAVNGMAVQPAESPIEERLFVVGSSAAELLRVRPLVSSTGASASFNIGSSGPNGAVHAVAVQFGRYLMLGGAFSSYNRITSRVTSLIRMQPEGEVDEANFNNQIIAQAQMSSNLVSTFSYKPGLKRYWLFDVVNRRYARISHYTVHYTPTKIYELELFETLPLTMMPLPPGTSHQWILQGGASDFLRTGPNQTDRGLDKGRDDGPAVSDPKDTWGLRASTFQITGTATLKPIIKVPLSDSDRAIYPATLTYYGMEVDNVLRKHYNRLTKRGTDDVDTLPYVPGNQRFNGYDFTEYQSRPVSGVLKHDKVVTYNANEFQAGAVVGGQVVNGTVTDLPSAPAKTLENAVGHVLKSLKAAGFTPGSLR